MFYQASKSADGYKKFADEWIFGVDGFDGYLEKLGANRLLQLKANSVMGYSTTMKRGTR